MKYWAKLKKTIRIFQIVQFDSDPVFDRKYLKTQIKSCKGGITINFNSNVTKGGSDSIASD